MFPGMLPAPPPLMLGRDGEIERFFRFLKQHKIFFIEGPSGIGKTAFALTMADELDRKPDNEGRVFWIDCYEGWNVSALMGEIGNVISEGNEDSGKDGGEDIKKAAAAFVRNINRDSYTIFIDDFQFIEDTDLEIFFEILRMYLRRSRLVFILNRKPDLPGAMLLDFYEQEIQPLKTPDALDYVRFNLEAHGYGETIPDSVLEAIVGKVFHYPYILKIIAAAILEGRFTPTEIVEGIPAVTEEIDDYILKLLLVDLDEWEMDLLGYLCLSRIPIPYDLIPQREVLDKLERKFMVSRSPDKTCRVHSTVRGFVVKKMSGEKKKALHKMLAENLARSEDAPVIREAVYHFDMAGEADAVTDLLKKFGGLICSGGHYEEILNYTERLLSEGEWDPDLVILHANVLSIMGKWEESTKVLEKLKESSQSPEVKGRIYNSLAGARLNRGQMQKALELYLESLDVHAESGDYREEIKTLNYLTFIYAFWGEAEKALGFAQGAMKLADENGFFQGKAHSLRMQGTALIKSGRYKEALAASEECEKLALKMKSIRLQSWAVLNKAEAYTGLGEYAEAEKEFGRAFEMGTRTGDSQILAFTHLGRGRLYYNTSDFDKALDALEKARENFKRQGNPLGAAVGDYLKGMILQESGNGKEAVEILENALSTARRFRHPILETDLIKGLLHLYVERGSFDKAKEEIDKGLELLDTLTMAGDRSHRSFLYLYRGLICYRNNDVAGTEDSIQKAIALAIESQAPSSMAKTFYAAGILKVEIPQEAGDSGTMRSPEELLSRLYGSTDRDVKRFFAFISDFTREEFLIKTQAGEKLGDKLEVEEILSRRDDFDLFVDVTTQKVYEKTLGEIDISRKRTVGMLLLHFVRNAGERFSPEELYREVWEYDYDEIVHAQEVRKNISRLRRMVEPDRKNPKYIMTAAASLVEKGGYYFDDKNSFCYIERK